MIAEPIEPINSGEPDQWSIGEPISTRESAVLTAAQVLAGMRSRCDRVWALDVEYDFFQKSFVDDDNLVPFGKNRDAFLREKRFKSQSGQHLADCETVFFPRATWAWNEEIQQDYQAPDQSADIRPQKYDWVDSSLYLHNACLPVGSVRDELSRLKGTCRCTYITELFRTRRNWTLRPNLELIDGIPCHVLTDGDQYTFWVDPELDFATRQLASSTGKTIGTRRQTTSRTAFRDFRAIRDGFHAPWQLAVTGYDGSQEGESRWGKQFSLIVYEVRNFAINVDVDEDLFTLHYPARTVVRDAAHMRFYRLGDDHEEVQLGDWE